ncbi:MAG: tRNA uridine-5-carboxymethylaminomethyl(34) synthesis GTPase MnmE, partial [Gammaproteobacteria bacterium]|nr:tRNA uridine-5-carboxymethylaminomethyl(34) synthesis GTPase MnmE [Gammaproteobacteria bacterium]
RVLFVIDIEDGHDSDHRVVLQDMPSHIGVTTVFNKIDKQNRSAEMVDIFEPATEENAVIYLSAKNGQGIDLLKQHLKQCMGYQQSKEGQFIARRRHLDAIDAAERHLITADINLHQLKAGELLAEELRLAQDVLASITGEFSSDDLLGRIFSDFCIGK